MIAPILLATSLFSLGATALPSPAADVAVPIVSAAAAVNPYAPHATTCPTTPLVRPATGLSTQETSYLEQRKAKASKKLRCWIKKQSKCFGTSKMPVVGFTVSGGGYRSFLCGAGVIQGMDKRDSNLSTAGLLQGMTYQGGLSGGSWLLSSLYGNDYPTVSSLSNGLWQTTFQDSLLDPEFLIGNADIAPVTADVAAKNAAGFHTTLTDVWGRLLSYQFLYGYDGGVAKTMSGIASSPNFTNFDVPFPIITSLGVKTFAPYFECLPGPNATTYEFTPYDFGSWSEGVSAFTPIQYLGTTNNNGAPATPGDCITNYDNLGYTLGTSSSLFNELCTNLPATTTMLSNTSIFGDIQSILGTVHEVGTGDEYAAYPNPFYKYARSSLIENVPELSLVDGGEALQNNPIFPFLQPQRGVDVLLVNDDSADTSMNFPNGSEILTTYVQSLNAGLTRMPVIPSVDTFISEHLNQRPTFFGCNDPSKITIIYIPNFNYTFMSNEPTSKLQYSPSETEAMIANGNQIITKGGDKEWPLCLACGIMKKTGEKLAKQCAQCFEEYCYN